MGYELATAPSPYPPPPPTPVPEPTLTPTPAPTATPTPTTSPTATVAPTPTLVPPCWEALRNGGFEAGEGWTIVLTAHAAGYVTTPAEYVTRPVRSGQRALRVGIAEGRNLFSYSSAEQTVTIPPDVTAARLSFWYLPVSQARDEDMQYLLLLKEDGSYDILMWERTGATDWRRRELSLDAYRGQRVTIRFGVHNDGRGGLTAMYVDDVSLALCQGVTPTPYAPSE